MKILVVTQYFWPEEFRINDICEGLKKEGHEVEILTGLPNYPKGELFQGYTMRGPYKDDYKGMKVMRVPMIPRGKSGAFKMMLNYLSFMIMGVLKIITLLNKDYDRIFMFQTSPITAAFPAVILAKIKKIKSYIYVQDLWPETFYSIIPVKNIRLKRIFKKICTKIYKGFSKILISSQGYENILIESGINKEKIIYYPQWAEDLYEAVENKLKETNKKSEFILTFAGNIGKAQGVDTIIRAAQLTREEDKNIKWRILGDGSEFQAIRKMVEEKKLEDSVELLGRKPVEEMPKYFAESDGLIVTLRDEGILKVTLPAKVQSYMAAGKPIIAAISGEGSKVIEEACCGLTGDAEDYKTLYKNVMKLYQMDENTRIKMGQNGKCYFNDNFTRKKLLKQLNNIINE